MRFCYKLVGLTGLVVSLCVGGYSQPNNASSVAGPFLGRWDLTLKTPQRDAPSWLEITSEGGQVHARLTSRWGHARPLPKVEVSGDHITFVSPKEEEDRKEDMVFEGKFSGEFLAGTTTGPDGTAWTWTGERAPELKRNADPKWGERRQLFNGKDLTGWHSSDASASPTSASRSWRVENGTLISPGHGAELITDANFEDFKLHIEFNCAKGLQ